METSEPIMGLVELLRQVRVPVCPRIRPVRARPFYPVDGYCVPEQSSGWFMIPSIEEFRTFCTGAGFSQCPWFKGVQADQNSIGWSPPRLCEPPGRPGQQPKG